MPSCLQRSRACIRANCAAYSPREPFMMDSSGFTDLLLDVVIPARTPWSHVLRQGQKLRLIDVEGQQAVDALFYSAADTAQRYSAQDTVREQGSAYIGLGTRLVSNHG